jgi:hypothetical protein
MFDFTIESAREFIEGHEWTFAKSMPKIPHWYVVKEQCRSGFEFEAFVALIRKEGYAKRWFRREFIYLDIDGWSYWTMGAPIHETTIINRAKNSGTAVKLDGSFKQL